MGRAEVLELPVHTKHVSELYVAERYPEVTPREFYREIFPEGELEQRGHYVTGKYCAIAVQVPASGRAKRFSVTDDLEVIDELVASEDFCIMSPVSYAGKSQRQKNARFLHALAVDLDAPIVLEDGKPEGIINFLFQVSKGLQVMPTFIVSSGTGFHLYYVLEEPVALFENTIKALDRLRRELIKWIWNRYVSELHESPQFESVTQSFRMVGSVTKDGDKVRAYRTGGFSSIEELNDVLPPTLQLELGKDFAYKSRLTLAEAKEKHPEWYERRIVRKEPRGAWTANRALYEWWKGRVDEVTYGHRYFYVMCLAAYARKCGIDEDELLADARALAPVLSAAKDGEPFEAWEAVKACQMYHQDYSHTLSREMISRVSAIRIEPNKRNGRKQGQHLRIARLAREMEWEEQGRDWRYHGGAPTKREQVRAWRRANPNGRKIDCQRETGISRPTVLKWWDS